MQFGRAGNWNDPRFLGEQPGECDLRGRGVLLFGDSLQQINDRLVRFARLGRKPRHDVAKVGAIERRVLVDLSGKKAAAERTEWNKTNTEFFEHSKRFLFRPSPPQR